MKRDKGKRGDLFWNLNLKMFVLSYTTDSHQGLSGVVLLFSLLFYPSLSTVFMVLNQKLKVERER